MKGKDLVRALSDISPMYLEEAAESRGENPKKSARHYRKFLPVMAAVVICVVLIGNMLHIIPVPFTTEHTYVRIKDYELLATPPEEESTNGSLEKEREELLPYVVMDGVVQLQLTGTEYNDALLPQVNIGTNGSTYLKKAIRELSAMETEEELRYLVEIQIFVPHPEYSELGTYADNAVYETEFERLTKEQGYELNLIPAGGYHLEEDFVYCLKCGIIYGALTEEEMRNFPMNEEYSYGFLLTRYEDYAFAECEYFESYTSMDEFRQYMRSLKSLQEWENEDEKK